ncbi:MAG: aspartate aminotransferase family protein [Chitinophagales bacterium]|nr:aspartate aminotransferase family protein [Chitinophagales bacterium]
MLSNRQLHLQYLAPTNPFPLLLEVERADGIYIYSKEKKYYDLISGISVSNLGHNNKAVISAIKEQLDEHMHVMVYGEFVQKPQINYANLLVSNLPQSLNSVYFVNSGAEATEGALKLARKASGRSEIAYFRHSYHGSTAGALSVMGDEHYKSAFRPLIPGNRMLEYNDINEVSKISSNTAAVIMETVQAESGVTVPDVDFVQSIRKRCDETGTLLILDEIQCGMGRSGGLFAFEHFGIVPDILLLAKALGGGLPLGAFICDRNLMSQLSNNPMLGHITTFGGNPICCAAGAAAFKELIERRLHEDVERKSKLICDSLRSHHIKSVHAKGLLIAIEFEDFETNKKVIDACFENGVITDWFLFNNRSMRIAPPLIIEDEEIEACCKVIESSISEALD